MTMNKLNCLENKIQLFYTDVSVQGEIELQNHQIVYILKGGVKFNYGYCNSGTMNRKKLIFLPIGESVNLKFDKDTTALFFRINDSKVFAGCYRDREPTSEVKHISGKKKKTDRCSILQANKIVEKYMDELAQNIKEGINEEEYFDLKLKELLYLLGFTYHRSDLETLFSSAIYSANAFSAFILCNNHIYSSVGEMSRAMNYTISGFEKRFKRAFGVPPAKWMREQKAKRIYQEVYLGKYSFKEIADRYNFSSTSTFNDFYKFNFGETPGCTRRKLQERKS